MDYVWINNGVYIFGGCDELLCLKLFPLKTEGVVYESYVKPANVVLECGIVP